MRKIAKFGGTSLATAKQILKVKNIILSDPDIRIVVPSAPGKADSGDTKVTDLLIMVNKSFEKNEPIDELWSRISNRFQQIIDGLDLNLDFTDVLAETLKKIKNGAGFEYTVSRGEALNGLIIAELLDAEYVDAAEVVQILDSGKVDPVSYEKIKARCSDESKRYVIPGFYGVDGRGEIKTFSRGGSDISGAVAANAIDADVYENWTDVSGFLLTDPRIVPQAATISEITYPELRELAYRGAAVLHTDAVSPVREKGIPINIRNTDKPGDPGTMIVSSRDASKQKIAGIAGKSGFSVLLIEKAPMDDEFGFFMNIINLLQKSGITYEQLSTSIDTVSAVIHKDKLENKKEILIEGIKSLKPKHIEIVEGIGLIAVVGEGMKYIGSFEADLFSSMEKQGVDVKMIDKGMQGHSILIGVEEAGLNEAIRAVYSVVAEN